MAGPGVEDGPGSLKRRIAAGPCHNAASPGLSATKERTLAVGVAPVSESKKAVAAARAEGADGLVAHMSAKGGTGPNAFADSYFHGEGKGYIADVQGIRTYTRGRFTRAVLITSTKGGFSDAKALVFYLLLKSAGIAEFSEARGEGAREPFNPAAVVLRLAVWFTTVAMSPLASLALMPYFAVAEYTGKFLLGRGSPRATAFGKGRRLSGLAYTITRARMAKRNGLFGIHLQDYMGIPVTLHRGFVDAMLVGALGYPFAFLVSQTLLGASLCYLLFATGASWPWALAIPPLLLSPYAVKQVKVGVLELVAWSLFVLSFGLMMAGHPVLAALALGMLVWTHAGIAFLGSAVLAVFAVSSVPASGVAPLVDLATAAIVTVVVSLPFIVPFVRSYGKLARNTLINRYYSKTHWHGQIIHQAAAYALFLAVAFIAVPLSPLHAVALLPLAVLYMNTSKLWLFSAYTVEMLMLCTGAIFAIWMQSAWALLPVVYLAYTSPSVLMSSDPSAGRFMFDLTPQGPGACAKDVRALFRRAEGDRVALQGGPMTRMSVFQNNTTVGYILSGGKAELLNAYGPEFAEIAIYDRIVAHLHPDASEREVRQALETGGARCLAVYDESFASRLREWGYDELGTADCPDLNWTAGGAGFSVTLFRAPFPCDRVDPPTAMDVGRNRLSLDCRRGVSHTVRYGCFKGWRATQNGRELPIRDAKPGMTVKAARDGRVVLHYSYLNFLA